MRDDALIIGFFQGVGEMNILKRNIIKRGGIFLLLLFLLGSDSIMLQSRFYMNKNSKLLSSIPNGFGVSYHPEANTDSIELIKNAGFKWVRIDILWSHVEKEKGEYNFSKYDELNQSLLDHGIRPYYILAYSNSLYEKNKSVVTKEGREAFVKFVSAVTKRYSGEDAIWEIWNEPNWVHWNPQPSYKEYSKLVHEVTPVIRKQDPSGLVIAPALAKVDKESIKWLEEIFKRGVLRDIDALSVHPYRSSNPETVVEDYQKLHNLITKYTTKDIPIISGEWGYAMQNISDRVASENEQAEYLVRMLLLNTSLQIPISIWYDWRNDGTNPNNGEHNFGVMWNDGKPKMAFYAMMNLSYILDGYKFVEKIRVGEEEDYLLRFVNDKEQQIIVFWTARSQHHVNLRIPGGEGRLISLLGSSSNIKWEKNQLMLNLSTRPTYLVID